MSCGNEEHTPADALVVAKGGNIILTKNDRHKIRAGKVLQFHFHGSQFFLGRVTFFVSNEKNKVQKNSKRGKLAMQVGEVVPIVIDKEKMEKMQTGEGFFGLMVPCDPPFEAIVVTSEMYHEHAMKEQKK